MNRTRHLMVAVFAGILPMLPSAVHADTYHWKTPVAGNWNVAANWTEVSVPDNDGTASVVFPVKETDGNYTVTLSATYSVNSITITPPSVSQYNQGVSFNGGGLVIGAGGVTVNDPVGKAAATFQALELPGNQTWILDGLNNNAITLGKSVVCPAGVTWTVVGRKGLYFTDTNTANFKGKLRANSSAISFSGLDQLGSMGSGTLEWFNYDDAAPVGPYATSATLGGSGDIRLTTNIDKSNTVYFATAVALDMTNTPLATVWLTAPNVYKTYNSWDVRLTNAWSGVFRDHGLQFLIANTSASACGSFYPDKQRITLAGDNRGLVTNGLPHIWFRDFVIRIAHPHALGIDNTLGATLGLAFQGGAIGPQAGQTAGLLAANQIVIASDIVVTNWTGKNSMQVFVGADDAGTARFLGPVRNQNFTASGAQVQLFAPAGGEASFEGPLSGGQYLPFEASGGGQVVLSGNNSGLARGLSVRSATLVLASENAAGNGGITLGGTVPGFMSVRAIQDRVPNGWTTYKTNNVFAGYTITPPVIVDNATLADGDVILLNKGVNAGNDNGLFQLTAGNTLMKIPMPTSNLGARYYIADGADYGGHTFYSVGYSSANKAFTCIEEPTDPDVAVLIQGALTFTNAINVANNLSAGSRTIGGSTADASEFSGPISLASNVTFTAVAGGSVTVSGTISGAGDITKVGKGTVALTGTISATGGLTLSGGTLQMSAAVVENRTNLVWNVSAADGTGTLDADGFSFAGKTITLNVNGVLDPLLTYVLATGTTGVPAVSGGLPEGWRLSASGNSLTLSCAVSGLTLLIL